MKHLLALLALSLVSNAAIAGFNVIYGEDNRRDIYQVTNSLHKKLARSSAGMIHKGHFKMSSLPNHFDLHSVTSLERGQNVCPSEAFSQQMIAPNCSGFLVGPDTLVTAGHCYKSFDTPENVCSSFAWVFDYDMKSASDDPTKNIPISDVYVCKKVLTAVLDEFSDYAIIKLDRPVVGREPLSFRKSGKVSNFASLLVIGHPTGLPTKISPGGKVTRNLDPMTFSTSLDTFHGNSGSAVFDAQTGLVEGILVQGKTDYILSNEKDPNSCQIVNKCSDFGNKCTAEELPSPVQWGEVVLRIQNIANAIERSLKVRVD